MDSITSSIPAFKHAHAHASKNIYGHSASGLNELKQALKPQTFDKELLQKARSIKLYKTTQALFDLICSLIEKGGFCHAKLMSLSGMLFDRIGKSPCKTQMKEHSKRLVESELIERDRDSTYDSYEYKLTKLGEAYRAIKRFRVPTEPIISETPKNIKTDPPFCKNRPSLTLSINSEKDLTKPIPRSEISSTNELPNKEVVDVEREIDAELEARRVPEDIAKQAKQQMLAELPKRRITNTIAYFGAIISRLSRAKAKGEGCTMAQTPQLTAAERLTNQRNAEADTNKAHSFATRRLLEQGRKFPSEAEFPDLVQLYDEIRKYSDEHAKLVLSFKAIISPAKPKPVEPQREDWKQRAYAN